MTYLRGMIKMSLDQEVIDFLSLHVDPTFAPKYPWKRGLLSGQRINSISCLGSMYDQGRWVSVFLDDGEKCRMDVKEVLKLLSYAVFEARKKRTYRHLRVIALEPDPDGCVFDWDTLQECRETLQK